MNYTQKTLAIALICVAALSSFKPAGSGKYYTKNGHIDFNSKTSLEEIKANNESVVSVLDASTGKVEFKVPVNSFLFDKKLMQEHFNENYMETKKYPQASFSGTISNNSSITYDKNGTFSAKYTGILTMHGVAKSISGTGTITVSGTTVKLSSSFAVNPADYNISIPSAVSNKISNNIAINVNCNYQPLTP